ncbi:MAG: cobyric acid synthase [Acidimicrobiales bacterium]
MNPPAFTVPAPGEHGDDAARVAAALGLDAAQVLDLATSLNPLAPDIRLLVATTLGSLRRYPDAAQATRAMSEALGVDAGNVLVTNGGSEAIALVAAELGSGWIEQPEFSLYARHLVAIDKTGGRWRSNPHNPTGSLASSQERAAVWDEAFYPLATGSWTRGDAATGAVVLGSLTKLLACPGLRLGYVLSCDDALITRLARRQPRWSVSSPALTALPALLGVVDLARWQRGIARLRGDLCSLLGRFGLEADPSDANFVLVRHAVGLRDRLARLGVVVRDCTSFGLPGAVRIAVPSEAGLERLAKALETSENGEVARRVGRRDSSRPGRRESTAAAPRGALLVCGTASDVGKSQLVVGLCRLLARRGVRVAPFKAQNMSLNSYATPSGHEIGRAQGIQALAAGISPEVSMNPILLKPTGHRSSQVVIMGEPLGDLDAASYQATKRSSLLPIVLEAFEDLRRRFDVVICEGAGSPAEINLLDGDLVNLGLAKAGEIPALLVGDIERGGVLASIAGTFAVLPDELSKHLRAFVINKFRGEVSLLAPGLTALEELTGRPCAGVLPFLEGLALDAEDSLGLDALIRSSTSLSGESIDVAVVALPQISNFTDLDALAIEPGVSIRLVDDPSTLGDPDLVILPGSKSTVADLAWLDQRGIAEALRSAAADPAGPTIFGICAGYQMLGQTIEDDYESRAGRVEGIGLLPVVTTFTPSKRTRPRRGTALASPITGYEIHQGEPRVLPDAPVTSLIELDDAFGKSDEGCVTPGSRIIGTSLHGLFESDEFRTAFLKEIAVRRASHWRPSGLRLADQREAQINRMADAIEEHLDVNLILSLICSAASRPQAARP